MKNINFYLLMLFLVSCSQSSSTKKYTLLDKKCIPEIDGFIDDCWNEIKISQINGDTVGKEDIFNISDFGGSFRALHDMDNLYFLIDVVDDVKGGAYGENIDYWENDNVEIFLSNSDKRSNNALSIKDTIYNYQFNFDNLRADQLIYMKMCFLDGRVEKQTNHKTNAIFSRKLNNSGYVIEIKIPKKEVLFTSNQILCNIEVTDNDNNGKEDGFIIGRESGISWNKNGCRTSWNETLNYGILTY